LAANIVIRQRELEKAAAKQAAAVNPVIEDIHFPRSTDPVPVVTREEIPQAVEDMVKEPEAEVQLVAPVEVAPVVEVPEDTTPAYAEIDAAHWEDQQAEDSNLIDPVDTTEEVIPVVEEPVVEEPVVEEPVVEEYVTSDPGVINPVIDEVQPEVVAQVEPAIEPAPAIIPVTTQIDAVPAKRHVRPYAGVWDINANESKIGELVQHYNFLKEKEVNEPLSRDETWELKAIEDVLRKHGYGSYV
jgi:hypothetical protein